MYWESIKVEEPLYIERFYSFFEANYDSSFNFSGETHNFWECVYVNKGEICVSADEKVYDLVEGEIIIHKPLEFHKFHINSDEGVNLIVFSFSLDGTLSDFLRNKIIKLSDDEKHILHLLLHYVSTHKNPLSNDQRDFLDFDNQYPDYLQTVRSYIYLLLLSFTTNNSAVKTLKTFDSIIYQKAVRYMTENIEHNISIPEIAKFCNVGTTFIKLTFKKYSGISVHNFFLKLKMRYAVELLKNGHNVTEVSMMLGFCSQPYFSSAFKREFGYPPSSVQKIE